MNKYSAKKEQTGKSRANTVVGILVFLVVFMINTGIEYLLATWYEQSATLASYFLLVLYRDSLATVITFFSLIIGLWVVMKREGVTFSLKKVCVVFWLLATVYIVIVNILPVSGRYKALLQDGHRPSGFDYKYSMVQDLLEQETVQISVPTSQISTFVSLYSPKGSRSAKTYHSYYVKFSTEDNIEYISLENGNVTKIVDKLKKLENNIEVEYYPNSGVIKSIDGINKSNYQEMDKHTTLLSKEIERKEEQSRQAELEQLEKERKQNTAIYQLMEESIGDDIDKVEQEFQNQGLPFEMEVRYISSKLYNVNSIAFYEAGVVYVVKDNLQEDMIPVPDLKLGMTKEEIIDCLTQAGFLYECNDFKCSMHEPNTLHTYHFSPGTLAPRGYVFWFSVDE